MAAVTKSVLLETTCYVQHNLTALIFRGDHTSADFFLTVLPPKTETVVFSIDGSFTASVSIMGKDPKVRAGAVDVVRSELFTFSLDFDFDFEELKC
jgi:hypothetical protein